MNTKSLLLTATALGLMLPFTPALAQKITAPAAAAADEGEIIVTARKRPESILKVPVTETVLGAIQIQRANITNLFDVSKKTVGLKLGIASVESGALISIRGFGTTATDPGVDQSVSLNLDGLTLTEGFSYNIGTFDMQQIEVLKGPQSLFFGKSSPAGVVSIRTADPGDKFELIARTAYESEAHESRNELIVSGPITPTLGVRIAGLYDHFGGYFFNKGTPILSTGALPLGSRLGKDDSFAIRGTAVWKPISNFNARLKVNYTHDKEADATVQQFIQCPEGPVNLVSSFTGSAFAAGENCKLDRNGALVGMNPAVFTGMNNNPSGLHALDGGKPASRITQKFGTLEMNYTPASTITVTSVTGYYKLNVDVDYNCYGSGAGAPACMTEKRLSRRDFTEELRANSDFSGPLNFSLGAFYQDGKINDIETLPANTDYGLPPLFFDGVETIHIKSKSVFGQVRYKILPVLELAGGARYTDEKRHLDTLQYDEPALPFHTFSGPGNTPIFGTPISLTNPNLHSKRTAPEVSLTYTPTNDLTLFGDWKKAYKSGSYNIITPVNPAGMLTLANGQYTGMGVDSHYNDEQIQGFEIGIKSRLFDRQLSFNLTGYHYKAKNIQVGAILPAAGGLPVLETFNAAAAKIYGIEGDLHYNPADVPGLELFGAFNYNHARFTNFPGAPCLGGDTFADGCNQQPAAAGNPAVTGNPAFSAGNLPPGVTLASLPQPLQTQVQNGGFFTYKAENLSGYPLVRAPDWTATGGFHYEMPIGHGLKLGGGSDVQYSSKYTTILGLAKLRPYFYQKAFAKVNAGINLTGPDDHWELAFIGNNLTNKLILNAQSGVAAQGNLFFLTGASGGPGRNAAGLDEEIGFVDRGRELWVKLTVKFGS